MLLFILLTAKIPQELDRVCEGVYITGVKVTSLSYADDIILLARTPKDMAQAILTLSRVVKHLKLTINYEKSKIVTMGPWTSKKHN